MVLAAVERAMDARYDQVRFVLPKEDFEYLREQVARGRTQEQEDAITRMNEVKLHGKSSSATFSNQPRV